MTTVSHPTLEGPTLDELTRAVLVSHPASPIASLLLEMTEEDEASQQNLVRVVASDRPLAGRLRHIASSEATPLAHPIPTIRHAMSALGFRAVHSGALACTFIEALPGSCSNLHFITFWRHAVAVAMLAQVLASVEQTHRDQAFAAGLLHNTGRLILDQHAPAALEAACRHAESHNIPLDEAVRLTVGYGEAELSGAVTSLWKLPEAIVTAVSTWQDDAALVSDQLNGLVARAAAYAALVGISDGIETEHGAPSRPDPALAPLTQAMERLGGESWLKSRVDTIIEAALLW